MIFALAAALLTALAVAAVLIPVLRRHRRAPSRADYDLTVYRDQLRELESDRGRGLVSEEQVEAARTEIERRMLRAARARDAAQAAEPAQTTETAPPHLPRRAGREARGRAGGHGPRGHGRGRRPVAGAPPPAGASSGAPTRV
ncbi:MAG: c-type cytochrome biogenesis protein CcmI, partial [Rhodospirillales bacterium]|nr:c-type cytochrome biogenesis protein CcmI [Rhodospirillales bacterium]